MSGAMGAQAAVTACGSTDAGDYLEWLESTLASLVGRKDAVVPCGDCQACCRAGYFIPVRKDDWAARKVIPSKLLVHLPMNDAHGTALLVTTRDGRCAVHQNGGCSIYPHRPQACREYDCRIFAAAGVTAGSLRVDARAERWRFQYRSAASRRAHSATRAVARLMIEHADAFPGRRAPTRPADIAVAALKAHRVPLAEDHETLTPTEAARRVVDACHAFDSTGVFDR